MNTRLLYLAAALIGFSATAHASDWGNVLKGIMEKQSSGTSGTAGNNSTPAATPPASPAGSAKSLAGLSESEMAGGLKDALAVGVERAINGLARPGGYLNDPAVRIPLPPALERGESTLRALGQGKAVDDFRTTLNRAAEAAVPQGAAIVGDAIRAMTISDAQKLVSGADDAATQYFRDKTWDRLAAAMQPIVQKATSQTGVTSAWKNLASRAGPAANLLGDSADLDRYVTTQTLEGLFVKLADEERAIRQNPAARSTELLKKVFGSVFSR